MYEIAVYVVAFILFGIGVFMFNKARKSKYNWAKKDKFVGRGVFLIFLSVVLAELNWLYFHHIG